MLGIILFQTITCLVTILNSSGVYVAISVGLLVMSVFVFVVTFSKGFYIEKELTKKFLKSEGKEKPSSVDINCYSHPMEPDIETTSITITT